MTKISVIVPFYEKLVDLLLCVNTLSLSHALPDTEFILNDDASPSVDLRMAIHPAQGQVWRNDINLGFAGNCNSGASHATGDILFFCNQDIQAVPNLSNGWDAALVSAFDNPEVGIIGPRLIFPYGRLQSAGGLIDAKGQPYHRCLGYSHLDNREINEPCEVSWVTGAALAIRRGLFEQLGGFDMGYRSYFEDVTLCLQARELGYQVWYTPVVSFIHKVGSTGGSPHFMTSAMRFKRLFVDTGRVKPDVSYVRERFW